MSRPRRANVGGAANGHKMVSWDEVDLGDGEQDSSEPEDDSSTEFGSDDIYISEHEADVDVISDDGVLEEALPVPGQVALSIEAETVEKDLERVFTRNVEQTIAKQGATKDWSFSFQEELRDDVREATGVGLAKVRKTRRNAENAGPKLTSEAQRAFGDANLAFVSGQTEEALHHFQEVIRMEPRHIPSWSALATCYGQLGDHEKALQVEIMGAHLKSDAEQWFQLGQKSHEQNLVEQALYCYRKACRLNSGHVDAYWELAALCKEAGNVVQAAQAFQNILKTHPHNVSVINQLLPLAPQLKSFNNVIDILQAAFNHYQQIWPHGPPASDPQDPNAEPVFHDYHVIALADILNAVGRYEAAIKVIRTGARWLQGRSHEKHLDSAPDDREFDADGVARPSEQRLLSGEVTKSATHHLDVNMRQRLARARIKNGDIQEGRLHTAVVLKEDVEHFSELFLELGDALAEKNLHADALPIYERVMQAGKDLTAATVMNLGACYRFAAKLSEAEDMYELVLSNDPTNRDAKLRLAEVFEAQNEPKKALALVYAVIDARKKSGDTGPNASNENNMEDSSIITAPKASKKEKQKTLKQTDVPRRPTRAEIQQKEKDKTTEIQHVFSTLEETGKTLDREDDAAVQGWMNLALALVDDFREARELFPASRYALSGRASHFKGLEPEAEEDMMVTRLEAEINSHSERAKPKAKDFVPSTYRNISFERWLKVIVQYSLLLTSRGQGSAAQEILSHVSTSYVFGPKNDPDGRVVLLIAQIAIASYTGNQHEIISLSRTFTNENQFNNEPLRIMLASLSPGLKGTDAFIDRNMNKWGLRLNRVWDMGVDAQKLQQASRSSVNSEREIEKDVDAMQLDETQTGKTKMENQLRWSDFHVRWVPIKKQKDLADAGDEEREEDMPESPGATRQPVRLPESRSPIARLIQGSMLNASKTNHGALYYLFEAHEVQPYDPLLCLSIAVSTLGRSLGRRADNRQHLIVQGVAFLEEYRKYRGKDNLAIQEVEYNFGRFFHQLNLGSFAANHYKRVLELAEEWQQDNPDDPGFGPEAAYNLSLLYVLSGASQLAKQVYQRWLSI